MARVLTGLCLTCVTLNFFNLNYIPGRRRPPHDALRLPRPARGEPGLRALFVSAILRAGLFFAGVVLGATRFYYAEAGQGVLLPPLRRGLDPPARPPPPLLGGGARRAVEGGHPEARGERALAPRLVLPHTSSSASPGAGLGWIGGIGFLAAFAAIICSLRRLYSALDDAGYAVRRSRRAYPTSRWRSASSPRRPRSPSAPGSSSPSTPWTGGPSKGERGEEARAVGASLAELGFPEDILADMSDEDILACEGAYEVYTELDYLSERRSESGYENVSSKTVRHVVVYLPGNEIRLVQHFVMG